MRHHDCPLSVFSSGTDELPQKSGVFFGIYLLLSREGAFGKDWNLAPLQSTFFRTKLKPPVLHQ